MRSCGRATSRYSAAMMEMHDAHDAWCPPTFSPSRLGRMWLALWIIHADSHRSLRSNCLRMRTCRDSGGISGVTVVTGWAIKSSRAGGLACFWPSSAAKSSAGGEHADPDIGHRRPAPLDHVNAVGG